MHKVGRHLGYANVTATLSLILAIGGGTAFALSRNSVGTAQLKNNAVTAKKIKSNAVTTAKIKSQAVTGDKVRESTLGPVPSAATADRANSAVSANPEAFAEIGADGAVDTPHKKGISSANVSHPSVGTYCITLPGFAPHGAQVVVSAFVGRGSTAQVGLGRPGCELGVQVLTSAPDNSAQDLSFYVQLYR